MKRTIFSSILMIALTALFYSVFTFDTPDAVSKQSAEGTIEVCWAPYCSANVQTTVVNLVDARGNILASCTITPSNHCCKMRGDFPTGTYHFEYYRPTGTTLCKSADFHYINGTDITKSVICNCP